MNNADRKQIIDAFIRIIDHFSDKNYQMRVWIQRTGPESQAFDDAVCDFFDIGDPILKKYHEFGISKTQYHLLENFRNQFKTFSDENDFPEEFIDTSEWKKIMNMAKQTSQAFKRSSRS